MEKDAGNAYKLPLSREKSRQLLPLSSDNLAPNHQTTNLGVRSSNLFGRAINLMFLLPNFCAIFWLLTTDGVGQHRGNTTIDLDMSDWSTVSCVCSQIIPIARSFAW